MPFDFGELAKKIPPDLMKQGIQMAEAGTGAGPAEPSGDGPSSDGSGAEAEVANDVMCKGFQEMFTKNQNKYNDFLFKSLAGYFNKGHTKMMLDKMLNKNMGEYIKSNQFNGIVKSEIQRSVGAIIQSTLKSELRNRKNYSGMCNEIDKLNKKRYGGGKTKIRTRNSAKKRRTLKRGGTKGSLLPPPIGI